MASDEPQSHVLDLLYDDELDADARRQAQRDVDQSDEARRALNSFESVLDGVRQADIDQDVPPSTHDAIMNAARQHAADNVSRQAQVTRRAPTSRAVTDQNLWRQLRSGRAAKLGVAASAVVIGVAVVFVLARRTSSRQEAKSMRAATAQNQSETPPTGGQLAKNQPSPFPDRPTPPSPAEPSAVPSPEGGGRSDSSDESKIGKVANLDERANYGPPQPSAGRGQLAPQPQRDEQPPARHKSKASLLGASDRAASHPTQDRSRYAERSTKARHPDRSPPADLSNDRESGIADSADLGGRLGSLAGAASSESQPPRAAKSAPPPTAGDDSAPAGVAAIETRYRNGEYSEVVARADRYLSGSAGASPADTARVLELKARALAQQSEPRQADAVWRRLQNKYPSYKHDMVRRERVKSANSRSPDTRGADEDSPADSNE